MTVLMIVTAVGALFLGIYLGLPKRFDQSPEEIDKLLGKDGEHATVDRKETFISILHKRAQKGSDRRRTRTRRPFKF
ncbi:MAG: hypothetical protein EA351_01885 [Gemmatimonadales bacterium]|nr:MAG: hypothetical protein EA351_01885 [Gemmatimonadales bacterium]